MRLVAWYSVVLLAGRATAVEDPLTAAAAEMRAERFSEAEKILRSALSGNSESVELELALGRVLVREGRFEEAVEALGHAVQLAPDSLACNMGLAEALIGWRHFAVAMQFLEAIEPKFKGAAEFQYNLGLAHFGVKHTGPALPHFEEALRLDPNLDKARFFIAGCHAANGAMKEATAEYRALVKDHPENPAYWLALAQVLDSDSDQTRPEAIEACRRALALRPTDAAAGFELAALLTKSGDLAAARPLLEHLAAAQPNVLPAHVLLSKIYFRLGLKELALKETSIVRELQAGSGGPK